MASAGCSPPGTCSTSTKAHGRPTPRVPATGIAAACWPRGWAIAAAGTRHPTASVARTPRAPMTVPGPMAGVTRALAQVRQDDVRALAVYISSLMADAPAGKKDQPQPLDRLAV